MMKWLSNIFKSKVGNSIFSGKNLETNDEETEFSTKRAEKTMTNLPWHGNDIYLEDKNNQIKAVCSNAEIALALAACAECYSSLNAFEGSKTKAYARFIQDAYYLYVAMSKARIPVNSVETAFVEKAFHRFCESLNEIVLREKLTFAEVTGVNTEDQTK